MRVALIVLMVAGLTLLPFVWLQRPWALRLWRKVRLLFVIYAVVILVAAIVGLIFRWDQIYG